MQINIWRTIVAPGESTYIWTRDGNLPTPAGDKPLNPNAYSLDDSVQLTSFHWGYSGMWDDAAYSTGLTVPEQTAPGTYRLHVGGADTGVEIEVAAPKPQKPAVVVPPSGGPDSSNIQAALNAGKSVQLLAGVYTIDRTIELPPDVFVRGAHRDATILKVVTRKDEFRGRIFLCAVDNFTISDMTADGVFERDTGFAGTETGICRGATIQRVRLLNMSSIELNAPGALVEDVEFKNSGSFIGGNHQLWKDISFEGKCGNTATQSIAVGEQIVLINAMWRDTSRGLILREGPVDSLFSSLVFDGIQCETNGDEIILVEDTRPNHGFGRGLQNSIFQHIRIRNCSGQITFWCTPVINNLFRYMQIDGGGGIWFVPDQASQTRNVFENVQLVGCTGINMGTAQGNNFKGVAIINPRSSWTNQGYFDAKFYPERKAAITGSAGNVFNPRILQGLPEGWTEMD